MLAHRLRRWASIVPTLGERIVYAGITAREMSFSSLVTSVPPQAVNRAHDITDQYA